MMREITRVIEPTYKGVQQQGLIYELLLCVAAGEPLEFTRANLAARCGLSLRALSKTVERLTRRGVLSRSPFATGLHNGALAYTYSLPFERVSVVHPAGCGAESVRYTVVWCTAATNRAPSYTGVVHSEEVGAAAAQVLAAMSQAASPGGLVVTSPALLAARCSVSEPKAALLLSALVADGHLLQFPAGAMGQGGVQAFITATAPALPATLPHGAFATPVTRGKKQLKPRTGAASTPIRKLGNTLTPALAAFEMTGGQVAA